MVLSQSERGRRFTSQTSLRGEMGCRREVWRGHSSLRRRGLHNRLHLVWTSLNAVNTFCCNANECTWCLQLLVLSRSVLSYFRFKQDEAWSKYINTYTLSFILVKEEWRRWDEHSKESLFTRAFADEESKQVSIHHVKHSLYIQIFPWMNFSPIIPTAWCIFSEDKLITSPDPRLSSSSRSHQRL